ncbi:MAG: type III secretion system inner rod subunit SctI [Burkholderiaceae bacterium]|nr:type III secretion system inner rod subunit SctI [Burkholderiaceae bacterium]
MNIAAISDQIATFASANPAVAATPTQSDQQRFSALLAQPANIGSPDVLLGEQAAIGRMIVETEMIAKVAGSVTQSINKLANMQ